MGRVDVAGAPGRAAMSLGLLPNATKHVAKAKEPRSLNSRGTKRRACALLLVLAVTTLPGCASDAHLRPFTTDGCSDFADGTPKHKTLWRNCCVTHDKAYWVGGTYAERLAADKALRQCVAAVGEPHIGALMLAGVRVGGSPFWPTRFRWGYGWPWPRGYRPLTAEERAQVDEALRMHEQSMSGSAGILRPAEQHDR
jgi:hypothetical protein